MSPRVPTVEYARSERSSAKSSQAARNSALSVARSSADRLRQAGSSLKNVNLTNVRSATRRRVMAVALRGRGAAVRLGGVGRRDAARHGCRAASGRDGSGARKGGALAGADECGSRAGLCRAYLRRHLGGQPREPAIGCRPGPASQHHREGWAGSGVRFWTVYIPLTALPRLVSTLRDDDLLIAFAAPPPSEQRGSADWNRRARLRRRSDLGLDPHRRLCPLDGHRADDPAAARGSPSRTSDERPADSG